MHLLTAIVVLMFLAAAVRRFGLLAVLTFGLALPFAAAAFLTALWADTSILAFPLGLVAAVLTAIGLLLSAERGRRPPVRRREPHLR